MTDQERDPEAHEAEVETTDVPGVDAEPEAPDDADGAEADDEADDETTNEADDDLTAVEAGIAGASAGAAARTGRKGQGARQQVLATPSVSDRAVHVNDRASAIFVIGVVGMFVAIFAYALLFGYSGFVTNVLATPVPTVAPSASAAASPSAATSASPVASASAAASPSAAASASPAASPSAAASASPVASPSVAPSPSPSAS
ncbi:MAG: hypothetical protein ABIR11_09710 [Candidatus Limnocylindrales bacterium]